MNEWLKATGIKETMLTGNGLLKLLLAILMAVFSIYDHVLLPTLGPSFFVGEKWVF